MPKLTYFDVGGIDSKYSLTEEGLTKKALILVEGQHTDSKKRVHTFDRDFIQTVADNTNTLFEQGSPVPILLDHVKSFDSTVGGLESPVYVEIITEANLPNKKARHLLGKLGIFTDQAVIKSGNAIEKVSKNIVKTISAGVDLAAKCIREVSLTSTPSIAGMTLFHSANFETSALTFDDLENEDDEMEQVHSQYQELADNLWELTKNIQLADPEALNGANPDDLQQQALQDFGTRFMQLIGFGQDEQDQEDYQDPRLQQNSGYNPNFKPAQQPVQQQSKFSVSDAPIAAFSMAEMESLNADFGIFQSAKELGGKVINRVGSDLKQTKAGFRAGRQSVLGGNSKATLIDHTKAIGKGVLRAGRRLAKTKTGRGVGIGLAGTAAVGAGIGGFKALTGGN